MKSLFGAARDAGQLALDFDGPLRDADALLRRLRELGLTRIDRCQLTRNRNVMVSYRGTTLRVHEGFLDAPAEVLRAIVAFVEGRTRAARRGAQGAIVEYRGASFPADAAGPPARRERTHADDEPLSMRLCEWHARLNAGRFDGALAAIPVRVSRRMRSRLGHYAPATAHSGAEIAISRRHLRRHGWDEAIHTLLHEMVHQWQDETRRPIDHGPIFRARARAVGIEARARRAVGGPIAPAVTVR